MQFKMQPDMTISSTFSFVVLRDFLMFEQRPTTRPLTQGIISNRMGFLRLFWHPKWHTDMASGKVESIARSLRNKIGKRQFHI